MNSRKNIILMIAAVVAASGFTASAQTNHGFVQQENIKVSGITTDAQIYPLSDVQKQTTRTYVDGLGRGVQTIGIQASPAQNDLIQPVVYDNLGRQTKSYLPYAGQVTDVMGSYRANATTTDQESFYNNTSQHLIAVDTAAYARQVFDNSPLQRLLLAGMVGTGFQPVSGQHYKTVKYRYNNTTQDGNIMIWNADGTFTTSNYYAANALSVTDGTDEDNTETLSYTDQTGHMILKRQILSGGNLDTYYLYNWAGMISYVIPPKALALMVTNGSYSLTQTGVSKLIFKFVYDTMGRMIEKTVPAKGKLYMVYDPLNRPVLAQDSNMRVNNKWNYIKYDAKGRPISQGIYVDATHTTRTAMQTYVSGLSYTTWYESRSTASGTNYYTNVVFPTTGITPLAYAFFENYDLQQTGSDNYTYATQSLTGETGATTAKLKGVPTMVWKTTVGSGVASGTWLLKAIFYDKRGNTIQIQSNNHVYYVNSTTLTDTTTMVPDFAGVTQITKMKKQSSSSAITKVQTKLTYDHMYRITNIDQYYNGSPAVTHVAHYVYNELGQVVTKNLGNYSSGTPSTQTLNTTYTGTNSIMATSSITLGVGFSAPSGSTLVLSINEPAYLQNVDMRYNIRGQLLSINNSKLSNDAGVTNNDSNDLFGMQFLYDQTDANLSNTAYYNGKLSAVKWMSKDASGTSSYERAYKYSYDGVNRYTASSYAERTAVSTSTFSNNTGGFDEAITYDNGGNITALTRNSSTQGSNSNVQIDNLAYAYDANNPNQLKTVTDGTGANYTGAGFRNLTGSTGNYTYDGNGNLGADPYKGLTLAYDDLNRTDKITVTTATNRYINYTYDANGSLIRKQAYDNNILQTTTDYVDGFVYVNSTLSYFPMPEGRLVNSGGVLKQEYIISDQQGNAKLSFQDNGAGTAVVKQENSYYATGLIMPNSPVATPTTPNNLLYNGGSEWQNDYSNLPDYYQTLNRNYDAAIARFIGVDPVAESAANMTSYQYAGNNPVLYNDPLGSLLSLPGSHNLPYIPWAPLNLGGPPSDIQQSIDGWGGTGQSANQDNVTWENNLYNDLTGTGTDVVYHGNKNNPNFEQVLNLLYTAQGLRFNSNGITYFTQEGTFTNNPNYKPAEGSSVTNEPYVTGVKDINHFLSYDQLRGAFLDNQLSRTIVADVYGFNISWNVVNGGGIGMNYSFYAITRGPSRGFYITQTASIRAGLEDGATASIFAGYFLGDILNPGDNDPARDMLGTSIDLGGALGGEADLWTSFRGFRPIWAGVSVGVGPQVGASVGVGNTEPIHGFK